jgi:CP family cyanate transporter-like MFS transporter
VLIVGSAFAGAGLIVGYIVLPAMILRYFPKKVDSMNTVYAVFLYLFPLIAALLATPINKTFGWSVNLILWALVSAVAFLIWTMNILVSGGFKKLLAYYKNMRMKSNKKVRIIEIERVKDSRTWLIAAIFVSNSICFFTVLTWIVTICESRENLSSDISGLFNALMLFAGLMGALISFFLMKLKTVNYLLICVITTLSWVFVAMCLPFPHLTHIFMCFSGLAFGVSFPFAFSMIALLAKDSADATALSSLGQFFSYVIACFTPFLLGFVGNKISWDFVIIILVIVGILQVVVFVAIILKEVPEKLKLLKLPNAK